MSSTKSHLTHKQRKVLNAIDSYIIKNQKSPTISELRELLKYSSTRTVLTYLQTLEKKNVITRQKGHHRGITIKKLVTIQFSAIQMQERLLYSPKKKKSEILKSIEQLLKVNRTSLHL